VISADLAQDSQQGIRTQPASILFGQVRVVNRPGSLLSRMMGPTTPRQRDAIEWGSDSSSNEGPDLQFTTFVLEHEARLRRAFVAAYGGQRGREATAESLAFAWEHWDRISKMENAPGYLFRVGGSRTRLHRSALTFMPQTHGDPIVEPALTPALKALSARQRTAVVLVHGFGWTLGEVAELMGTKVTTVQNHLERGLAKLRHALEGDGR
jgi:DNA-directed RNA polymerase specialized sigma24 family protein